MIGNITAADLAPDDEPVRMVKCETCKGTGKEQKKSESGMPMVFSWGCTKCDGLGERPETDDERHERQVWESEARREPKAIDGQWRRL